MMVYGFVCIFVFLAAYTLNLLYISVFYHRGLAHEAIRLHPGLRRFVILSGNWVTGLDPKAWTCMHRLHHTHSDTRKDPHSPLQHGTFRLILTQLRSYNRTLLSLMAGKASYTAVVRDLEFPVNWLNRNGLWFLPYVIHALVAMAIAVYFNVFILAGCYFLGIMSHPIQGWMVNSLGHRFGYRNFATPDNSRNNMIVAWLVFGEGFQNNHHQDPSSPKFSVRRWEVDMGYWLCGCLKLLGALTFNQNHTSDGQRGIMH